MKPSAISAIFDALAAAHPGATTELHYQTPFQLLIAVMLSAQTTDKAVNLATATLFAAAPTPLALATMGEENVLTHIRRLGLAPTKARNAVATARLLLERHGDLARRGQVPDSREALEALPGVGRKTANVILNTLFGQPTLAVDTHVFRLANRTGLAPGKTVREVENALMRVVPQQHILRAHHYLILHGRYVCTAKKPKCGHCVIAQWCEYEGKTE